MRVLLVVVLAFWAGGVSVWASELRCTDSVQTFVAADTLQAAGETVYPLTGTGKKPVAMYFVPHAFTLQYAGSIGAASFGIGWTMGRRDRWETDFQVGILPRQLGESRHVIVTLRERFVPWKLHIARKFDWHVEPLTCGAFLSFICGNGYWLHEPSTYPASYYGFTPKMRVNIFMGQRLTYDLPRKKNAPYWATTSVREFFTPQSVAFFYELSVSDLEVISVIPNRHLPFRKALSLALGVRATF